MYLFRRYFSVKSTLNCTWKSTIFALSSGRGRSGVAVIRVSGSKARNALYTICGMKDLPAPRHAIFRKFKDPATQEIIDRGIVIWFPGPRSFTGEDTCEFHVHGSPAVISCMLSNLNKLPDFQPAEPGEFTRRGFHLGKFDLTEVEGLADLLAAETDEQRKHALIQMEGSLKHLYNSLRHTLIKCVAHMEAYIDFSEDENIEMDTVQKVNDTLNDLKEEIQKHILYAKCGERLRDGVRTAIIGKPNVGKSSLLNILLHLKPVHQSAN